MTHGSSFVLRIAFGGRPPPPAEAQLPAARRCPLPAPPGRRPGCGAGKAEPALPGTARPLDRPDPQPRALAAPGDRDAPPGPLRPRRLGRCRPPGVSGPRTRRAPRCLGRRSRAREQPTFPSRGRCWEPADTSSSRRGTGVEHGGGCSPKMRPGRPPRVSSRRRRLPGLRRASAHDPGGARGVKFLPPRGCPGPGVPLSHAPMQGALTFTN